MNRWTLENDCGVAVGIVFAACEQAPGDCQSGAWKYEIGGMYLPGKAQRTVTGAEETRHGQQIRYVACIVTTPSAIRLIGLDSEERSSQAWMEAFDAASQIDPCLVRVQQWTDAGRRSGVSIDALIGPGLPGRTRQAQG